MERSQNKTRKVFLSQLKNGESGVISTIITGERGKKGHGRLKHGIKTRLEDMGLTPGTKVTMVKSAPFHGPSEILVRSSRLALGRGTTNKID